ncbi:MAG: mandelate racemase/muconate lactonizing enzyme family protein [Solirubrobacteraceae bacterium]
MEGGLRVSDGAPRSSEDPLAVAEPAEGDARITAVEAIPFSVPYRRAAEFASGVITRADNVLVRVHTDVGVVGQAEAQPRPYTYGETQASILSVIEGVLGPQLIGLSPFELERIAARCAAAIRNNQVARGALDLALWDAVGKLLGKPCSRLLGGFASTVAAAHMVSFGAPEEMAAEALELSSTLGIGTFKVKVGRSCELDVAAVTAIREALPDANLYVDANRGWSYPVALRAGHALIELGVNAIEEPIAIEDRAGRRRLAERWGVPLVGDESCVSLACVDRALEDGVGMVSVKTARTGFTESRRILGLCMGRSVPIVMGSQYEGRLGALATVAFAAAHAATAGHAAEVTNFVDLASDIVLDGLTVRDGEALVPDLPGLGAEIDEDALEHYREDA